MRWRVNLIRLARHLSWACVVLAVAAYGAVVVRNVTGTLEGILSRRPPVVVAQQPSR